MNYSSSNSRGITDLEDLQNYLKELYASISYIIISGTPEVLTIYFSAIETITFIETQLDIYINSLIPFKKKEEKKTIQITDNYISQIESGVSGVIDLSLKNVQYGCQTSNNFLCKNKPIVSPAKIQVSGTNSFDFHTNLNVNWDIFDTLSVSKSNITNNGCLTFFQQKEECLIGTTDYSITTTAQIADSVVGSFLINVCGISGTAVHCISKNKSNLLPSKNVLVSSPPNCSSLNWGTSSGITLSVVNSGLYDVSFTKANKRVYVNLISNNWVTLPDYYHKYNGTIIIYSGLDGAPCSTVSITNNSRNYNVNVLSSCSGVSTNDQLNVKVINDKLSQIQIRKDKISGMYNGVYCVSFLN